MGRLGSYLLMFACSVVKSFSPHLRLKRSAVVMSVVAFERGQGLRFLVLGAAKSSSGISIRFEIIIIVVGRAKS